jgi:hypothetical protein
MQPVAGSHSQNFCDPAGVRFENDAVGNRDSGLVHGHEDLPRPCQPLLPIGFFVRNVRHEGVPD